MSLSSEAWTLIIVAITKAVAIAICFIVSTPNPRP
jgi:hypothetical protein